MSIRLLICGNFILLGLWLILSIAIACSKPEFILALALRILCGFECREFLAEWWGVSSSSDGTSRTELDRFEREYGWYPRHFTYFSSWLKTRGVGLIFWAFMSGSIKSSFYWFYVSSFSTVAKDASESPGFCFGEGLLRVGYILLLIGLNVSLEKNYLFLPNGVCDTLRSILSKVKFSKLFDKYGQNPKSLTGLIWSARRLTYPRRDWCHCWRTLPICWGSS